MLRTLIATLAAAILVTILACPVAQAALTEVNVRVEGRDETLFEGPILTEGHDVEASSDTQERPCDGTNNGQHMTPGPTPTAAAVDAMSLIGETFDGEWYPGYDDYFITRWGPDEQSIAENAYWGILVNNVFTDVGGCQYELNEGAEVLWVYNAFAEMPFLALLPVDPHYESGDRPLTATAELNKPFEVEVLAYADDEEDIPPAAPERTGASAYAGADVSPVLTSAKGFERVETESPETVVTNPDGKASITFKTAGWHRIKATVVSGGEEAAVRSNRLDVCVPESGKTSCGQPPAEDLARIPSRYEDEVEQQHGGTTSEAGTDGDAGEGQQNTGEPNDSEASTTTAPTQTPTPTPTQTQTTAPKGNGPIARLTVEGITPKRLLLSLTAPGRATVKIARQTAGRTHHRHWQTIKTLTAQAGRAGRLAIKLPPLIPGVYRVTVSLPGAKSVVERLIVPHARR